MSKVFATYKTHYTSGEPEGHIYLDKKGACTITLTGAASMRQHELDHYGKIMTEALNKSVCGTLYGHRPEAPEQEDGIINDYTGL